MSGDRTVVALLIVAIALLAAAPLAPQWLMFLLALAIAKGVVVLGLVLLMRTGLVSFGQGLYFGLGAYSAALLAHFGGIADAALMIVAGTLSAAALAAILGLLLARYREIFFAMLSLAFSMILYGVLVKSSALGSTDGFNLHAKSFAGIALSGGIERRVFFAVSVVLAFGVAWLVHRFLSSHWGRLSRGVSRRFGLPRGVRQLRRRVRACRHGRRVRRARGGPRRPRDRLLDDIGRIRLRRYPRRHRQRARAVPFGGDLRGLAHDRQSVRAERMADVARAGDARDHHVPAGRVVDAAAPAREGRMSAILSAQGLQKNFGAVTAASDVSLAFERESVVGLIGANGAGKTTFLNMVTGYLKPDRGSIQFEGRELTGHSPREITALGLCRSFQIPQLFHSLSVRENLLVAEGIAHAERAEEATDAVLSRFSLTAYAAQAAGLLPEGVRKLLDVAMALVAKPKVLLLDEPTSGVAADEKFGIMDLVMSAVRGAGVTVLFVEHDMDIVSRYASRVIAFYDGRVIADGAPAAVLAAEEVRRYVIGEDTHAAH
jgi:branched-chain amino acid transport system ATP-binding protein